MWEHKWKKKKNTDITKKNPKDKKVRDTHTNRTRNSHIWGKRYYFTNREEWLKQTEKREDCVKYENYPFLWDYQQL